MTTTIEEIKNGPAVVGEILKFTIETTGKIVVSNQVVDSGISYSCSLMTLRKTFTNADSDYVVMTPEIPLDKDNNYQQLGPGQYAIKVTTAADIIAAVEK